MPQGDAAPRLTVVTPTNDDAGSSQPTWTDARVQLCKQLWLDGLSASEIARRLGKPVSRNAVLGKLYRLGIHRSGKASHRTPRKQAKPRLEAAAPIVRDPPSVELLAGDAWVPEPGANLVPLERLSAHTCKWPYGEAPFLFCGKQVEEGKPYCATHDRLAYLEGGEAAK